MERSKRSRCRLFINGIFAVAVIGFAVDGWAALPPQEPVKGSAVMKISCPDFEDHTMMPKKFTCEGADVNPTIRIDNVPPQAKSMVLIVDDPDAPVGTWTHWVLYDVPVLSQIDENSAPGRQALTNFGNARYQGPCPPFGTHRYFFRLYALDEYLNLKEGISRQQVEKAMKGRVIAQAEMIGLFKRSGQK